MSMLKPIISYHFFAVFSDKNALRCAGGRMNIGHFLERFVISGLKQRKSAVNFCVFLCRSVKNIDISLPLWYYFI